MTRVLQLRPRLPHAVRVSAAVLAGLAGLCGSTTAGAALARTAAPALSASAAPFQSDARPAAVPGQATPDGVQISVPGAGGGRYA
jgi:hypothetical protein